MYIYLIFPQPNIVARRSWWIGKSKSDSWKALLREYWQASRFCKIPPKEGNPTEKKYPQDITNILVDTHFPE